MKYSILSVLLICIFCFFFFQFKSTERVKHIELDSLTIRKNDVNDVYQYCSYGQTNYILTNKGVNEFSDNGDFKLKAFLNTDNHGISKMLKINDELFVIISEKNSYTVKKSTGNVLFTGGKGGDLFNSNGKSIFYADYTDVGWKFIFKKINDSKYFKINVSPTSSFFNKDTLFVLNTDNGYSILKCFMNQTSLIESKTELKIKENNVMPYLLGVKNGIFIIAEIAYDNITIAEYDTNGEKKSFISKIILKDNEINKSFYSDNYSTYTDGIYQMCSYNEMTNKIEILIPYKSNFFKKYSIKY